MKHLVAVIRPEKLEEVVSALADAGVHRFTVSDCRGIGGAEKTPEVYRGAQYTIAHRAKVRLDIALADSFLQPAIDAVKNACHTGDQTDGVIFVSELRDFVNIATGESGESAI